VSTHDLLELRRHCAALSHLLRNERMKWYKSQLNIWQTLERPGENLLLSCCAGGVSRPGWFGEVVAIYGTGKKSKFRLKGWLCLG
jgi:hypothetical protein